MPIALDETHFHHPPPPAASVPMAATEPSSPPVPIPMVLMDVSRSVTNGTGNSNGGVTPSKQHLATWRSNGGMLDSSRSPSVGETFVSAAASASSAVHSDGSDSESGTDGPEEEEVKMLDLSTPASSGAFRYITTTTITLSGAGGTATKQPFDRNQLVASPGQDSGRSESVRQSGGMQGETHRETYISRWEGPSSSGASSIALSVDAKDDLTMRELNERYISITVVPEKKGILLKHSEYEIKLKGSEKPVRRRYKDFVTLHAYLAEKYPYRALPALPPKQLIVDSIEQRRRGLLAWLTFVAQHPALRHSAILSIFLKDTTTDYRYRMCVAYEKQIDEFARLRENVTLPAIDVDTVIEARARLRCAHSAVARLMKLMDHDTVRTEKQAHDRGEIDRILSNELCGVFGERYFEDISVGLRGATMEGERYVQAQHRAVIERLHLLLDALYAHSDLCDRVEKGVMTEYQKALLKTETGGCDVQLERRAAYAFCCIRSETELIQRELDSLGSILLSYAHEEQQHHQKMAKIWHQLIVTESGKLI
ncbi:sorting nexin-8-like [Anopheles darlingi]|uniref:sorting nexin-8-like n=1 Tax=Anopheles darlingi TaxID=43151 RepID=UPI002100648D|nr:sorting nexin-8-like [Anopheles darlingi]